MQGGPGPGVHKDTPVDTSWVGHNLGIEIMKRIIEGSFSIKLSLITVGTSPVV